MEFPQINEKLFFIGIDGGGSKCRAVITNNKGSILGVGYGGPANPLHGFQRTIDSILDASNEALKQARLTSLTQLVAGVGLAGVNLPHLYQQVKQWRHPFKDMFLTTDLDIANIGAHSGEDGAVIIVGTGSCGYARCGNNSLAIGGHGFPIGDKSSGAWMGLEAMKHTLLVLDGFIESSKLSEQIVDELNVENGLSLSGKLAGSASGQYAKLASLVLKVADEGDPVAVAIIDEGVAYIKEMVYLLSKYQPGRFCMLGGLSKYILPRLPQDINELFVLPKAQPEIGAVFYAMQKTQEKIKQIA